MILVVVECHVKVPLLTKTDMTQINQLLNFNIILHLNGQTTVASLLQLT